MILLATTSSPSVFDLLIVIFNGITAISILVGILTIKWNRNQSYFSSVQACNEMFRRIVRKQQKLKNNNLAKHEILLKDHLGLISEEIFYIRQGILPPSVAYAWLADMPRRVPVYDTSGKFLNLKLLVDGENRFLVIKNQANFEKIVERFGRIKERFTMKTDIQFCPTNWETERIKFAHQMYIAIRGTKFERFKNIFRAQWKSGKW